MARPPPRSPAGHGDPSAESAGAHARADPPEPLAGARSLDDRWTISTVLTAPARIFEYTAPT